MENKFKIGTLVTYINYLKIGIVISPEIFMKNRCSDNTCYYRGKEAYKRCVNNSTLIFWFTPSYRFICYQRESALRIFETL